LFLSTISFTVSDMDKSDRLAHLRTVMDARFIVEVKPNMDPTISGNDGHGKADTKAKKGFFRRVGRGLVNALCCCVRPKLAT